MKQQWYNNFETEVYTDKPETLPEGYVKGRLKPTLIKLMSQISKEMLFDYYMIQNHPFEETVEHFNLTRGHLRMLLDAYNIKKNQKLAAKNNKFKRSQEEVARVARLSSKTQKEAWNNKSDEEREAWRQHSITTHNTIEYKQKQSSILKEAHKNLPQYVKDELNQKRSSTLKRLWETDKEELLEQRKQSERQNKQNTQLCCRTHIEQKAYDALQTIYSDVQYDVKVSDLYPYYVDFYIPQQELFIEIQGHPSHGKIPYDPNNSKSLEEAYKLYGEWLRIYTIVDVEKYKTSVKNKLNFIRIYPYVSIEENFSINNNGYKDIIELIYNALK